MAGGCMRHRSTFDAALLTGRNSLSTKGCDRATNVEGSMAGALVFMMPLAGVLRFTFAFEWVL